MSAGVLQSPSTRLLWCQHHWQRLSPEGQSFKIGSVGGSKWSASVINLFKLLLTNLPVADVYDKIGRKDCHKVLVETKSHPCLKDMLHHTESECKILGICKKLWWISSAEIYFTIKCRLMVKSISHSTITINSGNQPDKCRMICWE